MKNPSCLSSLYMCWQSFRYLLWNGVLLLSCNVFFISWSNILSPLKLNYHKQLGCSFLCEQTYKFTRSSDDCTTVLIFTFYTDWCFFFVDSLIRYCFSVWADLDFIPCGQQKQKSTWVLVTTCSLSAYVSSECRHPSQKNTAVAFLTFTAVRKGLWKGVVAVIEAPITAGISVKGSATIPSAKSWLNTWYCRLMRHAFTPLTHHILVVVSVRPPLYFVDDAINMGLNDIL